MKINSNRETQNAAGSIAQARKKAAPAAEATASDFTASTNLTQKIAAAPAVRADAVNRAKALIADPNYPDTQTVETVAKRLARVIKQDGQSE